MGLWERLFGEAHVPGADGVRILDIPSATNLREIGGYETPDGPVQAHRFLRCGSTRCMTRKDRARLRDYGVTHVLDLRGQAEDPAASCVFAHERGITWRNLELYHADISSTRFASAQEETGFYTRAYLHMAANHEAVRQIMGFLASVPREECALFHCAAGMDRTGVVSMLLLGMVGVSRKDITRDYLYSYAPVWQIDRFVETGERPQAMTDRMSDLLDAMGCVYDRILEAYGSIVDYLLACGLAPEELEALQGRLLK